MIMTYILQLIDLMHEEITLNSVLETDIKVTFFISFNKPQFKSVISLLIDIKFISERLRSEMSMSDYTSDDRKILTSSQSFLNATDFAFFHRHHRANF